MKSSIYAAILIGLISLATLAESRISKPHWSFNAFPSPNVKGHFNQHSMQTNAHSNSFGGSRFSSSSHGFDQSMTAERQAYLLGLAAQLLQHKQVQSEHSTRLLNSFGSRVASFSRKK